MILRRHDVPTDADSGRYEWDSLKDKEVIEIGKLIKSGEHKRVQAEALEKLKAKKAADKAPEAKKTSQTTSRASKAKPSTTRTRKRAVEEDED
jgi:hypothetical protein